MRIRKYHGIGNDFVMLSDLEGRLGPAGTLDADLVAALCDRHTGVGADGVIRLTRDADAEAAGAALRMDYYNADGGEAEMCGNGIRCLAVLGRREGLLDGDEHVILTRAGSRIVRLEGEGRVSVDMGIPGLERPRVPMSGEGSALRVGIETDDGTVYEGTGVSMGNPHLVLFTDDIGRELSEELVRSVGPSLEHHPAFPERTNVEFVEVRGDDVVRARVWERGVGETQACGTGACAAAVAAAALGRTGRNVTVELLGGSLRVRWAPDDHVWMSGPAEEVFSAELEASWLEARGLTLPDALQGAAS